MILKTFNWRYQEEQPQSYLSKIGIQGVEAMSSVLFQSVTGEPIVVLRSAITQVEPRQPADIDVPGCCAVWIDGHRHIVRGEIEKIARKLWGSA